VAKQAHMKRFTVSLPPDEYRRLRDLADTHRPRLSLQYLVQYSIHQLLRSAEDPQYVMQLGDPLRSPGDDEHA
jgi:hypothetical protein